MNFSFPQGGDQRSLTCHTCRFWPRENRTLMSILLRHNRIHVSSRGAKMTFSPQAMKLRGWKWIVLAIHCKLGSFFEKQKQTKKWHMLPSINCYWKGLSSILMKSFLSDGFLFTSTSGGGGGGGHGHFVSHFMTCEWVMHFESIWLLTQYKTT